MSSYLDRYLQGEHEQVWDELVALGEKVREVPIYEDVRAVAHETMLRVRHNLETLVPRLVQIGYQFGYSWIQPPANEAFTWQRRKQYQEMLLWAKEQSPLIVVASDTKDVISEASSRLAQLKELGAPAALVRGMERHIASLGEQPHMSNYLDELERLVGVIPLSIRAWYEVIGGVNLVGFHSAWFQILSEAMGADAKQQSSYDLDEGGHPFSILQPLHIYPLTACRLQDVRDHIDYPHGVREFDLPLMPNADAAYGMNSQDAYNYEIALPDFGADAVLHVERQNITFVNYLRTCFQWAGFPGWEHLELRPERDLAFLTDGLLPI